MTKKRNNKPEQHGGGGKQGHPPWMKPKRKSENQNELLKSGEPK
jgi:hypothetical protein